MDYQAKYDNSNNEYEVSVVCIVNLVICIIKLNNYDNSNNEYEVSVVCIVNLVIWIIKLNMIIAIMNMKSV